MRDTKPFHVRHPAAVRDDSLRLSVDGLRGGGNGGGTAIGADTPANAATTSAAANDQGLLFRYQGCLLFGMPPIRFTPPCLAPTSSVML